jgi:hypothetical protein
MTEQQKADIIRYRNEGDYADMFGVCLCVPYSQEKKEFLESLKITDDEDKVLNMFAQLAVYSMYK